MYVFNCKDHFFLMLLKKKLPLVLGTPWRIIRSVMTLFVNLKYMPDGYKTAYCPENQLFLNSIQHS